MMGTGEHRHGHGRRIGRTLATRDHHQALAYGFVSQTFPIREGQQHLATRALVQRQQIAFLHVVGKRMRRRNAIGA
ncbi:hypothetical protein SDC9_124702 [bioreactor metagenome]|uniref:Uncharacterized protein n=1 Tax=bioreactor metagenome TaxID=1076179 RepID=A0A645CL79_9ZZZZ